MPAPYRPRSNQHAPRVHQEPVPAWRASMAQWTAEQREDYAERVALIMDGCAPEGVTLEIAERRAWECVAGKLVQSHLSR